MDSDRLDNELKNFDFSLCHPIREQLLRQLLALHRQENAAPKSSLWTSRKMSEDEMDWASAAGNPALQDGVNFQRQSFAHGPQPGKA